MDFRENFSLSDFQGEKTSESASSGYHQEASVAMKLRHEPRRVC